MPRVAAVGSRPIPTVASPMSAIVRIMAGLRPTRSPMWAMISPPRGRKRKPTAKVAKAARSPAAERLLGKKSGPMIRPAAAP